MIEALKSSQLFVRSTATEQLTIEGIQDLEFVMPILCENLKDPDWWTVRFGIVEAIQEIAVRNTTIPDKFVHILTEYLKDDDLEFRAKIASCLGDIKNPHPVALLLETMRDESDETREMVATALGKIKDKRAIDILLHHLNDKSEYVVVASAEALGEILEGDREFKNIEPIIKLLVNSNLAIQVASADALRKISHKQSIIPILKAMRPSRTDSSSDARESMLNALLSFSEEEIKESFENESNADENKYLDLIEEAVFQYPFEKLLKESVIKKEKLISKYQRNFRKVKSEIDSINSFVADVFKNLASISILEEAETIFDTIPRKRSNLERIDINSIASYSWVKNSLYQELKEAGKLYQLGVGALNELELAVTSKIDKLKLEQTESINQ